MNVKKIVFALVKYIFLHALLIFGFIVFIKGHYYSRGHLFVSYFTLVVALVMWRFVFIYLLQAYRRSGSNYRNIVIIGANKMGYKMLDFIKSDPSLGFRFLGFLDDNKPKDEKALILGSLNYLKEYAKIEMVDEVYYTLPITNKTDIRELMTFCENNLIHLKIIPEFQLFADRKVTLDFYNKVPVLTLRKDPMDNIFNILLKRAFDIVFSLGVIVTVFPIIVPMVFILTKLTSKGPVFFRQKRSGKNNKEFYCYKFRTMKVNKEADTLQASINDSRITLVGKYLRKFDIDELPQFINVLLGDMTVVGPRPHMLKHTQDYSKIVDKFMARHFVKPGITGWAQVKGYRGETESPYKMVKRVRYDLWYIENWTFLLDIKIIFLTIFSIFRKIRFPLPK